MTFFGTIPHVLYFRQIFETVITRLLEQQHTKLKPEILCHAKALSLIFLPQNFGGAF